MGVSKKFKKNDVVMFVAPVFARGGEVALVEAGQIALVQEMCWDGDDGDDSVHVIVAESDVDSYSICQSSKTMEKIGTL